MQDAIILAGGKSSRMGQDKTLLELDSVSMTHFLYSRLSKIFKSVKVAAKSAKFSPPLPLLRDDFSDFGPIFVIATLDRYFKNPVFLIAADTPFVKKESIKELFGGAKSSQICVAKDESFTHYLCGFYSPSVAGVARDMIASGDLKLSNLAQHCSFSSILLSPKEQFFNINTPGDFIQAKSHFLALC